ncbi:trifunctional nucleotide phosphoesterase protein YfkN-like [Salvelinus alpinus]|uniref:trifunctional nucleotide phosphoesterase protein YfkN-like n=1 Tax=Salvelinus alpinus TaxID=8036 RepID=UPI0039FCB626
MQCPRPLRHPGGHDRFTSETLVHGVVSSILEWNGLKMDFMGLVEEDWMDTLGTVDKNDIKYIDYVETADRLSAELRDKGADLGLALTHRRWRNGIRLASKSNGVDLILGGHDHEYGVLEVNGILIVKSGSEFRYLSKSDVVKDQDGTFKYSCVKMATMKDLEEESGIQQSVKGYTDNMQHMFGEVLCHIDVALDGCYAAVRRAGCNLGNLVIYAMLEATHAEVAFLNSGLNFHFLYVSVIGIVLVSRIPLPESVFACVSVLECVSGVLERTLSGCRAN